MFIFELELLCVNFGRVFFIFWDFKRTVSMRIYRLTDRCNGEDIEVNADALESITFVEIGYVDWAIELDGYFENDHWVIVEL